VKALVWLPPLLALLLTPGCHWPGQPKPNDRPVREDQVTDFGKLFAKHCAGCHGGEGKLGPAPPLNDALFLAIIPDEELLRVVREGRPGTPMPAFAREKGGPLTAKQVEAVARGIKPLWGGKPPKEKPPPYLPPKGAGDKERGAKLFALACAACHGEKGKGADEAGALNDIAFLALISDQELRRIIITGRRDLGMPDYTDTDYRSPDYKPLTSEQIQDLVALLAYWRVGGSPNGK
jgi:cytochrome c oxidase cbb3-type subunit 3/ubiquinol-cytochrome c reductase cytochrome c subunit